MTQRLLTLQTRQVCVYLYASERVRDRETEADIMLCACECANMCVPARRRALKTNQVASIQHDDNLAGLAAQIYIVCVCDTCIRVDTSDLVHMHIHKNYGEMYTLYSITLDTLVVEGRCARGRTRPAERQLVNYFAFGLLLRVPFMRLF